MRGPQYRPSTRYVSIRYSQISEQVGLKHVMTSKSNLNGTLKYRPWLHVHSPGSVCTNLTADSSATRRWIANISNVASFPRKDACLKQCKMAHRLWMVSNSCGYARPMQTETAIQIVNQFTTLPSRMDFRIFH